MSKHAEYLSSDPSLPGAAGSYWLATSPSETTHPPLVEDITADIAVIGGGLAGALTAYELTMHGMSVALLEARTVMGDVTGHTTAKVTAVHGTVIADIVKRAGTEAVRLHIAENHTAVERVASLTGWLGIDCDLERVDTVAYVEEVAAAGKIGELGAMLRSAGLDPVEVGGDWGLPFPMTRALRLEGEVRFHPVKFGAGVVRELARLGGRVFEDSRVVSVDESGDSVRIVTAAGSVSASAAVVCTNYPFHDHGSLFSRLYPHRSYVLGAYLRDDMPDAMYIALDESLTLRLQHTDEGPLVIASGQHHRAGAGGDEREYYQRLEQQLRDRFEVDRIAWHWSTQDNYTPDGLPFIGRSPGAHHTYVASGFSAWGMSQSVVAAAVISQQLSGTEHRLAEIYDPLRFDASGSGQFIKENADVAKEFAATLLASGSAEDLAPGEGRRIRKGVHRVAAYRDYDGRLYEVSATCTHVGCGLEFNDAEKTWDCPCHGSRFSVDGRVLHGPAVRDLEPR